MATQFHGTEQEWDEMRAAVTRQCEAPLERAALLGDQRFLDGVLWGRHTIAGYIDQEFKEN